MNRFQLMRARCVWLGAFAAGVATESLALAQTTPQTEQAPPAALPPPSASAAPAPPPAPEPTAAPASPVMPATPPAAPTVEAHAPSNAPEKASDPFAFGDFTWLNGTNRQTKALLDSPIFAGSVLLDVNYTASGQNPIDNTVIGSTSLSRNNEFTLAFLGFGGDFHYEHARARLMTQFGVRSVHVPRPVRPSERAPLRQRGQRRLPLGRSPRHQSGCRHLHVVRGSLLVRRLRELDVLAVVHLGQHALVLQRHAPPDLSDRYPQDRAVAHQRVADVRQVQRDAWLRRAGPVPTHRVVVGALERLLGLRRSGPAR